MRASSSHCTARRSISAIRPAARRLACAIAASHSSSSARCADASAASRRPAAVDCHCAASAATSRKVGMLRSASRSPMPSGTCASRLHGARSSSSCRRLRHCRTRASTQKTGSPGAAVSEGAPASIGPATSAATSATCAPTRSSHWRAAAMVAGRESKADSSSRSRRTSTGNAEPPTASASTRNVSLRPSNHRGSRILWSASASSPGRNVIRCPARFPLSTDET